MEPWEKKYQEYLRSQQSTPTRGSNQGDLVVTPRTVFGGGGPVGRLQEGVKFYRQLQTGGFGGTVPLVREAGRVDSTMAQREFVSHGEVVAYPVEENDIIDMAYISRESPSVRRFQVWEAPFVGKVLVEVTPTPRVLTGRPGSPSKPFLKG